MGRMSSEALLAAAGYGCSLALSALSFWSPLSLVPSAVSQEAPSFYFLVHFGLVLSFVMVIIGHFGDGTRVPRVLFAAAFVLLVMGFALSANSLGGAFDLPAAVLSSGALCTGLGSGFALMCWMLVFERFALRCAWMVMVAGSVFAAVPTLTISFLQTVNPLSFSSLVLILLLLSLVFLVLAMQGGGAAAAGSAVPLAGTQESAPLPREAGRADDSPLSSLRRVGAHFGLALACIVVLALFQPLLDASGLNAGLSSWGKTLLSQGGNIAGALAMLAVGRVTRWRIDVPRIFLCVTPVFATVCLFFPFVSECYWFIFSFVSMLLFSVLSLGVMLSCLQFASKKTAPLLLTYGVLGFCLYAPGLIGMAAGQVTRQLCGSSKLVLAVALLLMVGICVALALRIGRRLLDGGRTDHLRNPLPLSNPNDQSVGEGPPAPVASASLEAACVALGEGFNLTAREGEILTMLAHGRNVPFIAETLALSSHTVRGYVKSLYARLDVHSRQELIDLVEQRLPSSNFNE
ncbi:MAG: helix-turn-helix transcriptional regulator [Adlercreutzia mucosicola]|uniref:HTH luxR-type domain-containing protein n=2 Tax=Adlercreutzia mucosicola TaxID=580026 RepID=A0A6N8JQC9_9ACTN|nr:helix-turn-helix transcriptional regulator [Adlercreutzia mucosicola]MVX61812.1 hypothetical protein [Adlercreutzia mucosicola]